jgi:hypothetical protein
VENLEINFSEGESLNWSLNVHKELTSRIGVYAVIRTITTADKPEEEIIYVGLANGENEQQEQRSNGIIIPIDAVELPYHLCLLKHHLTRKKLINPKIIFFGMEK